MKDILDKFGVTEFFAYLCPGVIVISSLALWIQPEFDRVVGSDLAEQQLVMAFLLLIVAYALGFVVAWWSNWGTAYYILTSYKEGNPVRGSWLRSKLLLWSLWLFHWFPLPQSNTVGARTLIADRIVVYSQMETSIGTNPWEMMSIYRAFVAGRVGNVGSPILSEAATIHTRLLFALAVNLAILLCAAQSFARLLLPDLDGLPDVSVSLLSAIGVLGVVASFALRLIAAQLWEQELLLTHGLTLLEDTPAAGTKASAGD